MYKDLITYKLADGITQKHLLKIAEKIIETWMSKQAGFIAWEIHKNNDGTYTDIVYWQSKEDAKKSESDMVNIPNASAWYSCYQEGSISSKNLNLICTFTNDNSLSSK